MLAIGTLLAANFTFAQTTNPVKFGVKAGANLANLSGSGVTSNDPKFGAYGGVFVNIPINAQFKIQPEVLYSMQGTKWTTKTPNFLPQMDLTVINDIKLDYTRCAFRNIGKKIVHLIKKSYIYLTTNHLNT